jgi:outer membrane protein TolC
VVKVASFIGRSAPKFYYNIMQVPFSPHLAQIIVETRTVADVGPTLEWVRAFAAAEMPEVELVARKLEQGPPVDAPVEVRLFGREFQALHTAADQVAGLLRGIDGTQDVRHDMGPGAPTVRFAVDDAAAARHGVTRADLARALYGRTRGLPVGELYIGEDPIPVVIRSSAGENLTMAHLETTGLTATDGGIVPLAQVARLETVWRPAVIRHRDGRRVVTVSSQLTQGATFSQVLDRLNPLLPEVDLPTGVDIRFGGDTEGSGEANTALMRSFPMGVLVLLGVLLAEFNSFRRVAIILATVPLAAAGVVPGLLLNDQPFGFMSLLGVIALVGIVVNNAIVLLEVVEARRREGAGVEAALIDAVARRIRPILLTTATTVAGLLPLAFSPSTLWPPLATAMISGLLAATLLTLLVVPAMTTLVFRPRRRAAFPRPVAASVTAGLLVVLAIAPVAVQAADPLTLDLDTAMQRAALRPAAEAARSRADAADQVAEAQRRAGYWPTLGASVSGFARDRDLNLVTPLGSFPSGERQGTNGGVDLVQPIIDPAQQWHRVPAAAAEARAQRLQSRRSRQELAATAADAYLTVLAIDARKAVTQAFIRSIAARLAEIREMVEAGRALEADALKLTVSADQARQDLFALDNRRRVAVLDLARSVGHDGPVSPRPAPDLLAVPVPAADATTARALDARPDLAALEATGEALSQRIAAVRAERLPTLAASASWVWADGSPYEENQWLEGALTVRWVPFAAGTRQPRQAALAARYQALKSQIRETRRGIGLEVGSALSRLETGSGAFTVAQRGVEMAAETLRVERERHLAGRATTNDLLDAEARLRERRTRRELARLEVVRAWVGLWLATGQGEALADLTAAAARSEQRADLATLAGPS